MMTCASYVSVTIVLLVAFSFSEGTRIPPLQKRSAKILETPKTLPVTGYGPSFINFGCSTSGGGYDWDEEPLHNLTFNEYPATGPPPESRFRSFTTIMDGKIYIFGGEKADKLGQVSLYAYNLCAGRWETVTTLGTAPKLRNHPCVAQWGTSVFMYGGWFQGEAVIEFYYDMYQFSFTNFEWTQVAMADDKRPEQSQFPLCVTSALGIYYPPLPYISDFSSPANQARSDFTSKQALWEFNVVTSRWTNLLSYDRVLDGKGKPTGREVDLSNWPLRFPARMACSDTGGEIVLCFGGEGKPIWQYDLDYAWYAVFYDLKEILLEWGWTAEEADWEINYLNHSSFDAIVTYLDYFDLDFDDYLAIEGTSRSEKIMALRPPVGGMDAAAKPRLRTPLMNRRERARALQDEDDDDEDSLDDDDDDDDEDEDDEDCDPNFDPDCWVPDEGTKCEEDDLDCYDTTDVIAQPPDDYFSDTLDPSKFDAKSSTENVVEKVAGGQLTSVAFETDQKDEFHPDFENQDVVFLPPAFLLNNDMLAWNKSDHSWFIWIPEDECDHIRPVPRRYGMVVMDGGDGIILMGGESILCKPKAVCCDLWYFSFWTGCWSRLDTPKDRPPCSGVLWPHLSSRHSCYDGWVYAQNGNGIVEVPVSSSICGAGVAGELQDDGSVILLDEGEGAGADDAHERSARRAMLEFVDMRRDRIGGNRQGRMPRVRSSTERTANRRARRARTARQSVDRAVSGGSSRAMVVTDIVASDVQFTIPPDSAPVLPEMAGHRMAVIGKYMYVFGGVTLNYGGSLSNYLDTIYRLDMAAVPPRWSQTTTANDGPSARAFHCMVGYNIFMMVYGGLSEIQLPEKNSVTRYDDLWLLDTSRGSWIDITDRTASHWPGRRSHHSCAIFANTFAVFGGISDNAIGTARNLLMLNLLTRKWQAYPFPLGKACGKCDSNRGSLMHVLYFNGSFEIVIIGGVPDLGWWSFRQRDNTWINHIAPNTTFVSEVSSAVNGPRIIQFGGGQNGKRLLTWDRRKPSKVNVLTGDRNLFPKGFPKAVRLGSALAPWGTDFFLFGGLQAESGLASDDSRPINLLFKIGFPFCKDLLYGTVNETCVYCPAGMSLNLTNPSKPKCSYCPIGEYATYFVNGDTVIPTCGERNDSIILKPVTNPIVPKSYNRGKRNVSQLSQRARQAAHVLAVKAVASNAVNNGKCQTGFFGVLPAATDNGYCLPCPEGTYQDQSGQATCKNCTAGRDCPVGSKSDGSDLAELSVTTVEAQELNDENYLKPAQNALQYVVFIGGGVVLLMMCVLWYTPCYRFFLRCDLYGRGAGQSYMGGFFTIFAIIILISLGVIQVIPTLTGALQQDSSLRPVSSLQTPCNATYRLAIRVTDYSEDCNIDCSAATLAANNNCTTGITVCPSGVVFTGVECSTLTINSSCTIYMVYKELQFVRNATKSLTTHMISVDFNDILSSGSGFAVQMNTTAAWPDQVSGFTSIFNPEQNTVFRGAGSTKLEVSALSIEYAMPNNGTLTTGYYLQLTNETTGDRTSPNTFFTTAGIAIQITFTLDDLFYHVEIKPVLGVGLAILLLVALLDILWDMVAWICISLETMVLWLHCQWRAYRNRNRSDSYWLGAINPGDAQINNVVAQLNAFNKSTIIDHSVISPAHFGDPSSIGPRGNAMLGSPTIAPPANAIMPPPNPSFKGTPRSPSPAHPFGGPWGDGMDALKMVDSLNNNNVYKAPSDVDNMPPTATHDSMDHAAHELKTHNIEGHHHAEGDGGLLAENDIGIGMEHYAAHQNDPGHKYYCPHRARKPWFRPDRVLAGCFCQLLIFCVVVAVLALFINFYLYDDPITSLT